jgi:hypothetical protein
MAETEDSNVVDEATGIPSPFGDTVGDFTYARHQSIIEGSIGLLRRAEPEVDADKARRILTDLLAEPTRWRAVKESVGGTAAVAGIADKKP